MASSTSSAPSLSASQHPRLHVRPRREKTYGDLAASFAADYGLEPDEWQQLVLDDWLAEQGGKWAALTCGLAVPRQNGKNGVLEIREVFGMVGLGEKFLHTAHEVKTAQKHFRRLKHFFGSKANDPAAAYPELNALVTQVRSVNGQEAIFLKNGGSVEVVARSKNSSRGFTVDVLVFDEAQELDDDAKEALIPTTSSAPLGNPQWIYTGTPPGPSAQGEAFTKTRDDALGGKRERVSWIEWSVPEGEVDITDTALVYATNPQLDRLRPNGTYGLQWDIVKGEMDELTPGGFARERLGQWALPVGASAKRLIPAETWEGTAVDEAPDGVRSLAITFDFDGSKQAVAGAVKHDDGIHVELIGAHSGSAEAGTASLVRWLTADPAKPERWRSLAAIAIAGGGAAGALHGALAEAGVPKQMLHVMTTPQVLAANAMTLDAIRDRTFTHPRAGEADALDASVAVCDQKIRIGGWAWKPTTPDGDQLPIEAVSMALWIAKTTKRRPVGERSTTTRGRGSGRRMAGRR